MKTVKKPFKRIPWTWADQISSYRFWGLLLFFFFMLIPNIILNYSYSIFRESSGLAATEIGYIFSIKSFASFGGLWLAWFLVRSKNHHLLYLYSGFTIIGLLLIYFMPSLPSIFIGAFLIGLSFGAISLAIPAIISGGQGGSEMFVVSFGLITLIELSAWNSFSLMFSSLIDFFDEKNNLFLIAILAAIIGTALLAPVNAKLFYSNPPRRAFSLKPTYRNPWSVALLCLIPLFNIYYIIHLAYRYHGEVNTINPSQKILSPRAAAWCAILLSVISPITTSSLNDRLIPKLIRE